MDEMERTCLFKQVFGDVFYTRPEGWQRLHNVTDEHIYHGEAEVERGSHIVTRLLASFLRLPPGSLVPVTLRFTRQGEGEIWQRQFGNSGFKTYLFKPTVNDEEPGQYILNERFGPLTFTISLGIDGEKLRWDLIGTRFLGVRLPAFLVPISETVEFIDEASGRYCFDIDLSIFYFGRLIAYRGSVALD